MEWLTSNLLPLTIATGIASIITIRLWWKSKPSKLGIGISLIGLALLGVGGYTVVTSTPGGIDVVDEDPTDGNQNPDAPDSAIETLLASWDSEAAADWPAAETLARISECVYDSPVDAERSFTDLGLSRVTTVTSGTMLGYVASGDDVTVIAFRGSEKELGDWLANFDRSPLPVDKGTIHGGFWNAYLSLKPQIEKCLAGRQTEHLWVTGHSLGGALALCCSYDQILNENREIDGLVTFGQPMVARTDLVEYLDDVLLGRYARFANKRDVVTRIPPSYRPCGSLVWFTDNGVKRSKPKRRLFGASKADVTPTEIEPMTEEEFQHLLQESEESSKVEYGPDGRPMLKGNSPIFADHSMFLYVDRVRELLGL